MLQPLLLPIWQRLKQNHYSIILRWKPNRNEPFYNAFERLKWLKESNQTTYTFSKIITKAFILNWLPFILKQHLVSPHIAPEEMRLKEVKWFFGITQWLFGEEGIWFLCLWFLKTILSPTKLYKSVTKKKDHLEPGSIIFLPHRFDSYITLNTEYHNKREYMPHDEEGNGDTF